MRIPIAIALLGLTASCAWPPPELAALMSPSPPPPAAIPAPPPPAPAAAGAPAPPVVDYVPLPLVYARWLNAPRPAGRLTLHNFSFASVRVQALVTSGPDCAPREGTATNDFVLPLNGTRIIAAPPGADVCWRHEVPAATAQKTPAAPPWTEWSRSYTASGRYFDSRL